MRRVGSFEIERDLYRRGFWTVSIATRAGDAGGARYAVKWMERPDDVLGPERAEALAVDFLKAAEAQRLACASGGEHWANVEDYGRFEGGAFVAWSLRPRSAADLAAGRFIFNDESAPWLKGIVLGVLAALREMRDGAGRGHGNLKPGNVLLATRNAWTPAAVALCDPSPDPPRGGSTPTSSHSAASSTGWSSTASSPRSAAGPSNDRKHGTGSAAAWERPGEASASGFWTPTPPWDRCASRRFSPPSNRSRRHGADASAPA